MSDPGTDPGAAPAGGRLTAGGALRAGASAVLAVVLIVVALPQVTGTGWSGIGATLAQLQASDVAVLSLVWVVGLFAYTYVLTATLPGLTHAQAFVLNVTGSGVSNVAPFGGAIGVAVTWAMARSWGFGGAAFTLSTLIAGVVNVLVKLALPLLGLLALLGSGELAEGGLVVASVVAAALLALTLLLLAGVLSNDTVALRTGRAGQATVHALLAGWHVARGVLVRSPRPGRRTPPAAAAAAEEADHADWGGQLLDLRSRTVSMLRLRWAEILLGLVGFYGSQALLQWLILAELGSTLGVAQVFAGFCFGRLLSSVVVTPGGIGIAETGAAGLLVALGGDPAVTASGVLLFSVFAFVLEIPAGALGYVAWTTRRSWRVPV